MSRLQRLLVLSGLAFSAIVLAIGGVQAWRWRSERASAIDEADSLRITNLAKDQFIAASEARAEQWKQLAERADSVGRAKDQRVAQLQFRNRQLDSVLRTMPNATASDSLQVYKQKVSNLTDQVIEIGVSRDSARSAWQSERQRARELALAKDSVQATLAAVEASNFRLRNNLASAAAPCRMLLVGPLGVSCPSRKMVYVFGISTGVVLSYYIQRRRS